MNDNDTVYKIIFHSKNKNYEIFATQIYQSELHGFIEVEGLIFNQTSSGILVDPGEEKVKTEFEQTIRSFIPIYNIVRIDEVKNARVAKVSDSPTMTKKAPIHAIFDKYKHEDKD